MNGIADEIKALSAEIAGYVVDIRRQIHRCPETSWQEFRTTELVRRELARLGIPCTVGDKGVGVVGLLRGPAAPNPGGAVALRADMDALPVTEETGLPFAQRLQEPCTPAATTATPPCCWGRPESSLP